MKPSIYVSLFSLLSSALVGCNVVLDLPPAFSETAGAAGESGGGASNIGGSKNKGGTSSGGSSSTKNTSKPTGGASSTGGVSSTDPSTTGGVTSTGGTSASTGGTSSTGGTTTVGSPVISSFTVDYNKVCSGSEAKLHVEFSNGTGTISEGVGTVTSGTDKSTGAIAADTTYTLTVTNSKGEKVEKSVSVTVLKNTVLTPTGAMSAAKYYGRLVLLPNGKVLIMTYGDSVNCNIEQYDVNTGTFAVTGTLSPCHVGDTTMTSIGNGTVLIVGGYYYTSTTSGLDYSSTLNADIYDPQTGKTTASSPLSVARDEFHAISLPTVGRVLIVGGDCCGDTQSLDTAELFIPTQGTNGAFSLLTMQAKRFYNATTLLSDGRVLITGGAPWEEGDTATAEIYDPLAGSSGSFTLVNSMNSSRAYHGAALLPNGNVLIAGGRVVNGSGSFETLSSAEVFDPKTGKFTVTQSLNEARKSPDLIPLKNGRVLVYGGGTTGNTELYNPATQAFTAATYVEISGSAVPLQNGAVLIAGTNKARAASAALYCP